jgi:hypothetical protein
MSGTFSISICGATRRLSGACGIGVPRSQCLSTSISCARSILAAAVRGLFQS